MKAAFYERNKTIRIGDCTPVDPGPKQVQIHVSHCGICGTDLHIFHGNMDHRVASSQIIGHEMSGTITAVGKDVQGWAIGDREVYSDDQDEMHASALYSLLESEIVPMYYRRNDEGIPEEWIRRVKTCLAHMSPQFNCMRMVEEYDAQMYELAHRGWMDVRKDGFESARRKVGPA